MKFKMNYDQYMSVSRKQIESGTALVSPQKIPGAQDNGVKHAENKKIGKDEKQSLENTY
jgi:hypothetical protein